MSVRDTLLKEVKKYEDIIIYGYRDIGTCVLDYMINLDTDIKMSNYSGRVRFFATSAKGIYGHEKKGIPIKCIDEVSDYAKDALVIVATQECHHADIAKELDRLAFENRIFITHEMYIELKEIIGNYNRQIDNQVRQYSIMHEMKLEKLKEKIAKGHKAKVFFMTQGAAAFGGASIYRAMEKSDVFDPYIFCISKRDIWYGDYYEAVQRDILFFEERGFRAINAYEENKMAKDLSVLKPDIIFWDSPNLYGPANNSHFRLDLINWRFLTCYIPYGLLMVDSFYYHYDNINIRTSWKYFLDTNRSYSRALSDAEFNGFNIVKAGYPKFDDYEMAKDEELPVKLQNMRKTVIYAPHWSLDIENNFATFYLYKDIILDYAINHPEINFVFKPHPELGFRIKALHKRGTLDFSYKDYEEYMKAWDSLPNGLCVTQGGYISIFERSDCMITDCGSFIGEYLPSLNPCIYLFNPDKRNQWNSYTPAAKEILDSYYIANTVDDLDRLFNTIVLDNHDEKRKLREKVLKDEFGNIGKVGQHICDYLEKELIE